VASHYAQASAAADAGNWEQAVAECTMITDSDPNYRDTSARLAEARHQQQLAGLLAEAHRLHRAGQWAAVINVVEQLQAIDPDAANPDGLIASARAELAAEQRAAKLAADYHTALHLFDAGRWKEAVVALERVTRLDSTYADRPAKDPARREEDGQPQSARKPGAGQPPPVDVTGPPVGNARTSVDNVHQVAERALGPQGGPEIEVLAEILGDNETLLNLAWGKEFGLKRGLIVLTDRRLLMVAGRRTAGEWPLSAITTKAWRPRHLWLEGIKFKTSARSAIFIDEVEPKARAGEIIDQINSITGNRYLPGRLDRS
jgi:tetratricopeptide (TPR) repeat protein